MTLEETIIHEEEVAEGQYKLYDCYLQHGEQGDYVEDCLKCAAEHRQRAAWLRELKESRMVLDILGQFLVDIDLDICCEDLTMTDDYCEKCCDNQKPLCWYRWAKLKAREVNTDED